MIIPMMIYIVPIT